MRLLGARRIVLLASALLWLAPMVPATPMVRQVAVEPRCFPNFLELSPSFRKDRTAFCLGQDYDGKRIRIRVYVTRNGGRSWEERAARGIEEEFPRTLVISEMFSIDHRIYLQTANGLFMSPDLGEHFRSVDDLGGTGFYIPNLEPFVADVPRASPDEPSKQTSFAMVGWPSPPGTVDMPARIDIPNHTPVLGSPKLDYRFLIPPDFEKTGTAFVVAHTSLPLGIGGPVLYRCNALLVCDEPLFAFERPSRVEEIWVGARYPQKPEIYAFLRPWGASSLEAWRSNDGGRTFTRWSSVDKLFPHSISQANQVAADLALHPRFPKRLFLRIVQSGDRSTTSDGVYRSKDAGTSWKLVAGKGGRRLPWDSQGNTFYLTALRLAPDGRLLTLAWDSRSGYSGPYCSIDGGRSWRRLCAR